LFEIDSRINLEHQIHSAGRVTRWQISAFITAAARRYLAARATSVFLLSSASDVCCDKQTCLLAETAECLVFLKANLA